jgi:hypothetical protein
VVSFIIGIKAKPLNSMIYIELNGMELKSYHCEFINMTPGGAWGHLADKR